MTERTETGLLRQQRVLARFGELALKSGDLDEILTEACRLVGEALDTDLAKVIELQDDGETLLVRAGVGWKPGVVGQVTIKLHAGTSEGEAIRTGEPVISSNRETEERFPFANFLIDNGVYAMVNVLILGTAGTAPYGILQVDSRKPREFTETDITFLRTYANLLSAAIERIRSVAELRVSGDRQRLLVQELQHRTRNLLTVIRTIAKRTLRGSDDYQRFAERLEGIARVQGFLSSGGDWVNLKQLVSAELEAHADDLEAQATMDGPDVALPENKILPLALAVHELTTNAAKHGALAQGSGRIEVKWHIDEGPPRSLVLKWREKGVEIADDAEVRRGYGRELIERALPYQLDAKTELNFSPDGLECTIMVPLPEQGPEGR